MGKVSALSESASQGIPERVSARTSSRACGAERRSKALVERRRRHARDRGDHARDLAHAVAIVSKLRFDEAQRRVSRRADRRPATN
jgi:hypothetical protein